MRFAYLLAPEPTAAQDLLQIALLRTYLQWNRVRDNPDAYVRRVLVTVAADERRRPWRREIATAQLPERVKSYDPTTGVDDIDLLRPAPAGLWARQRATVTLRYPRGAVGSTDRGPARLLEGHRSQPGDSRAGQAPRRVGG